MNKLTRTILAGTIAASAANTNAQHADGFEPLEEIQYTSTVVESMRFGEGSMYFFADGNCGYTNDELTQLILVQAKGQEVTVGQKIGFEKIPDHSYDSRQCDINIDYVAWAPIQPEQVAFEAPEQLLAEAQVADAQPRARISYEGDCHDRLKGFVLGPKTGIPYVDGEAVIGCYWLPVQNTSEKAAPASWDQVR